MKKLLRPKNSSFILEEFESDSNSNSDEPESENEQDLETLQKLKQELTLEDLVPEVFQKVHEQIKIKPADVIATNRDLLNEQINAALQGMQQIEDNDQEQDQKLGIQSGSYSNADSMTNFSHLESVNEYSNKGVDLNRSYLDVTDTSKSQSKNMQKTEDQILQDLESTQEKAHQLEDPFQLIQLHKEEFFDSNFQDQKLYDDIIFFRDQIYVMSIESDEGQNKPQNQSEQLDSALVQKEKQGSNIQVFKIFKKVPQPSSQISQIYPRRIKMKFKKPKYEDSQNYKLHDHLSISINPEWNKNQKAMDSTLQLELYNLDPGIVDDFFQRYLFNPQTIAKVKVAEDFLNSFISFTTRAKTDKRNQNSSIDWIQNMKIEFFQENDYLYYYAMERKGKHHGNYTLFKLIQVDIHQSCSNIIQEFKIENQKKDMIPLSAHIIKDHQNRYYNESQSFQILNREDLAEEFMKNHFMVIKFVDFYFDCIDDIEHQRTKVYHSIRNIKWHDYELDSFSCIRSDNIVYSIIQKSEFDKIIMAKKNWMEQDLLTQGASQYMLRYQNDTDLEIKIIETFENQEYYIAQLPQMFRKNLNVEKFMNYLQLAKNNNFMYLFDKKKKAFYYTKTYPIGQGTILIDVINNRLINIGGDEDYTTKIIWLNNLEIVENQRRSKSFSQLSKASIKFKSNVKRDLKKWQQYKIISQGNYGKQLFYLSDSIHREYTLSEHLAIDTLHKLQNKQQKVLNERRDQMLISTNFRNLMRSGDYVYVWEKYKLKPQRFEDPYNGRNKQLIDHLPSYNSIVFFSNIERSDKVKQINNKEKKKLYKDKNKIFKLKQIVKRILDKRKSSFLFDRSDGQNNISRIVPHRKDHQDLSKSNSKLNLNKLLGLTKIDKDQALQQQFTELNQTELQDFGDFNYKEEWRIIYERVRFDEDDRQAIPLLICKFTTSTKGNIKTLFDVQFFICVFDFYDEALLCFQKISQPEFCSSYLRKRNWQSFLKNLTLTQCSRIVEIEKNNYSQEYQIGYYIQQHNRVQIIQYRIQYDYRTNKYGDCFINQIGSREVFFRGHIPEANQLQTQMIELLPALNQYNQIIGSQLIFTGEETSHVGHHILIFENELEKKSSMPSCVLIDKQGYKLYRDPCNSQVSAIMAYVSLSEEAFNNKSVNMDTKIEFSTIEKLELIKSSLKAILNTVIFDPMEPMKVITQKAKHLSCSNFQIGRPFELLNWFSMISISNKSLKPLEQMLNTATDHRKSCIDEDETNEKCTQLSSLIERVIYCNNQDCHSKQIHEQTVQERLQILYKSGILIQNHGIIQKDIYQSTPIKYYCKSNSNISRKGLEIILNSVLNSEYHCSEAHYHLMSNMVNLICYLDSSSVFFEKFICQNEKFDFFGNTNYDSYDENHKEINIQQKINGIDDYFSYSDQKLQIIYLDIKDDHLFLTFNQLLQDQKQRERIKKMFVPGTSNLAYPVECNILDLRPNIYHTKIQLLKVYLSRKMNNQLEMSRNFLSMRGSSSIQREKNLNQSNEQNKSSRIQFSSRITKLELSELVQHILYKSTNNIKRQDLLRNIIDCQYQSARLRFNGIFLIYVILFILPYLIQIFQTDPAILQVCHFAGLVSSHIFIFCELVQLKKQGLRHYLTDAWNYVDCAIYLLYLVFWVVKHMHDSDHEKLNEIPNKQWAIKQSRHQHIFVLVTPLINLIMIFLLALKMLYFLRNFEKTSSEVEIIFVCVKEAQQLIFFLVFSAVLYSFCQVILGSGYSHDKNEDKQYPGLPEFMHIFLQSWINSIGEFDTPRYRVWSEWVHQTDKSKRFFVTIDDFYVGLIWMVWIINQICSEVIMLNFLIAVISDIYEKLQQDHLDVKYRNKCDVNHECAALDQALNQLMSSVFRSGDNNDPNNHKDQFNFLIIFKATGQEANKEEARDDGPINEQNIKNKFATLLDKFMEEQTKMSSMNIGEWMRHEFAKNSDYMDQLEHDVDRNVHEIKQKIQKITRQIDRNQLLNISKQIIMKKNTKSKEPLIGRNKMQQLQNMLKSQREGTSRSKKINIRVPVNRHREFSSSLERKINDPLFQSPLPQEIQNPSLDYLQNQQSMFNSRSHLIPTTETQKIKQVLRQTHHLNFKEVQKVTRTNIASMENSGRATMNSFVNGINATRFSVQKEKKVYIRAKSNNQNGKKRLLLIETLGKQSD